MKLTCFAVLATITALLSTSAFAQGLPTQKMLTIDVAETLAHEAMMKCRADGYKVTVTVVDSANMLKAFLRDDGSGLATAQIGRMKANSVMYFGRSSGPPPNLPAGAPVPPPLLADTINFRGGEPIKVGNQIIGAISVSGAPGEEKDDACTNYALAKVADMLK
jgi:uncharacterized protein GlcG (DUF336 family)